MYGGDFTAGSGARLITDGENLARKRIIVIGINYRVGIFGFLVHPELTKESPHQSYPSQIFIYYLSHPIPWSQFPQSGVFHCAEIPYVFNNLDKLSRPWQAVDHQLAKLMSGYWVNFVNTGNPNGKRLPFWRASVPNDNKVFNLEVNPHAMQALSEDKMAFFF